MVQENIEPQHIEIDDLLFFDELNVKEKQRIKGHLKECFTCSEKYREFAQIQSAFQKMKTLTHIDNKLLTSYVILKSGSPPETSYRLTKKEIELVEKHLEECPLCQEEFKLLSKEYSELDAYFEKIPFGEVKGGLKATVLGKVIKQMRAFGLRLFEAFDRKYAPLKWGIAVMIFFVGLLGIYPLLKSPANKYEGLAKIEPAVYVPMTLRDTKSADPAEAEFAEGMGFYQKAQYGLSIRHLKEVVQIKPEHEYAQFYLGVSYLFENKFAQAIKHFKKAVSIKDSPLLEKSTWYLGLAYLKKGDTENALQAFGRVVEMNDEFERNAKKIINDIQELK